MLLLSCNFCLHHIEFQRVDDRRVVVLNIVLRNFTLVDLLLFCKKIYSKFLLQKCVTLVFLVAQNTVYRCLVPGFSACWSRCSKSVKVFANPDAVFP